MDATVDVQMAQAGTNHAMSLVAAQQTRKTAPARGAMAFRSASLYWCAWDGASRPRRWRASQSHAGGNMNKLILAAASVAALALAGPASAQSPIVIKFQVRSDRRARVRGVRPSLCSAGSRHLAQSHRWAARRETAEAARAEGNDRTRLLGQRLQADDREQKAGHAGRLQGPEIPHPVV